MAAQSPALKPWREHINVSTPHTSPKFIRKTMAQMEQRDFLSALPFELFSEIAFHLKSTSLSVRPTRLKSLSRTTRQFRAYCLACGLFTNLKITLRHGIDSLSHINAFLT